MLQSLREISFVVKEDWALDAWLREPKLRDTRAGIKDGKFIGGLGVYWSRGTWRETWVCVPGYVYWWRWFNRR